MKSKFLAMMVGVALSAASGMACAQFGGMKLPGIGGDSAASSVSSEQIVKSYVGGARDVNSADVKMLTAVGLKDEAAKAELAGKNLTEGATTDSLKESSQVQTDSSKALEAKFKDQKVEMDAASKKKFSDGMADLGRGIIKYVGMGKEAQGFKPSPTAIGASTNSALFIVKSLPDSIKNLGSTLKSSIDFAKTNNIPVPKEASDATSMI
ncbi:hypothetical protein Q9Q94_12100 [Uliginosibacterium sp. 31-16]|uniref:hypothetical protein n=1 Tax=Uliginosibacterium sp. 31-16 TaxID=3068315 RepID=UPI00273FC99F|nr:hypothetical protein [Uliginosibacterium sp. 31-16]MDP5240275.1 hypothetical protein [Uliginosibacterium sp. 31-16]